MEFNTLFVLFIKNVALTEKGKQALSLRAFPYSAECHIENPSLPRDYSFEYPISQQLDELLIGDAQYLGVDIFIIPTYDWGAPCRLCWRSG